MYTSSSEVNEVLSIESKTYRVARELGSVNKWLWFILLMVAYTVILIFTNEIILTDKLYYNSYPLVTDDASLHIMIEGHHFMEKIMYWTIPLIALISVGFPAVCVSVGLMLFGYKTPLKKIFTIVMIAQPILIVAEVVGLLNIYWNGIQTYQGFERSSFLSLYDLFRNAAIPELLIQPLTTINIFQVLYVCAIALGMHWVLEDMSYRRALKIVAVSYGTGIFMYLIANMFIAFIA